MSTLVVGFPRIGEQRELKKVLEDYWAKKVEFSKVEEVAKDLRKRHWHYQKDAGIEYISSNDFSLYDNMLDTAIMLGAVPERFRELKGQELYFAMARGDDKRVAMEMTKWFNTNYHYIVPELSANDTYSLNIDKIKSEYFEAKSLGIKTKINLIGPITFLSLSKRIDRGEPLELHGKILPLYEELLVEIAKWDDEIVIQIDEPIFVKEPSTKMLSLIKPTYDKLASVSTKIKIIVSTYFEHSNEATKVLVHTPIWAIGLDFIHGKENFDALETLSQSDKVLIAGVVDGRNVWRIDLKKSREILEKIEHSFPKNRTILSTSCSLLHTPFTLKYEEKLDNEIKSWLSFAVEKLDELKLLNQLYFHGSTNEKIEEILEANSSRKASAQIHNQEVQQRVSSLTKLQREGAFEERIKLQREEIGYGTLPTTTIGSFPQTAEVRRARKDLKTGAIGEEAYKAKMREYIDECIAFQEEIDLDILVHGEPERNDMVEYFGQMLEGFAFTQNGWVQSYGSRCVKPPLIYGDVSRPKPMTVEWITYAQSKTDRVVKGMLTGPVTILNWSFVRDDIERSEVSKQIAVAICDEVDDLQKSGIKIIQVDEAAFKEGYPLRASKVKAYEEWAVRDFKIAVSTAKKETQIHTHMCYSEFNDIIKTIEAMDADVISIETARSGNELLKIFKEVGYKQEVGPGVYDIHSPRVPSVEEIKTQIKLLLEVLPKEQLWINPDCGLKTRKWEEVKPALRNMVIATKEVRGEL